MQTQRRRVNWIQQGHTSNNKQGNQTLKKCKIQTHMDHDKYRIVSLIMKESNGERFKSKLIYIPFSAGPFALIYCWFLLNLVYLFSYVYLSSADSQHMPSHGTLQKKSFQPNYIYST